MHFIFQVENFLKGGSLNFFYSGRGATENFMPSAGGGLVEFFASASEDPRPPQDVNSATSLTIT